MVVVDEAQRIKNYATKSAAYVKALDPEYRIVLTGTPMENRLEELASVLDWVDDVALSPKWRLVPWHTRADGDGGKGASGARNLETLRARIGTCTLRRLRRDVLGQLPSRTDTRVPIEMTEQQRTAHDELSLPIAVLARKARTRPLTQPEFLRLMSLLNQQRIISNGLAQVRFEEIWPTCARSRPDAALLEGLFAPKLVELRRLLADLVVDQGRKVVVFSQWRRMLRLAEWSVRDVLAEEGCRAVFFTGAESPAQRTRAIVDFHDDPNVRVMFLSDAGGVGLNLQRAASACINLEMPWNPAVLEQRIGRIHASARPARSTSTTWSMSTESSHGSRPSWASSRRSSPASSTARRTRFASRRRDRLRRGSRSSWSQASSPTCRSKRRSRHSPRPRTAKRTAPTRARSTATRQMPLRDRASRPWRRSQRRARRPLRA
jgi:SNF2 family DNA or RNA helicase